MAQKQYFVRLFLDVDLARDRGVVLDAAQAHYIGTVMRRKTGEDVVLFNGRDGEWLGQIQDIKKKHALVHLTEQLRPQKSEPDIHLLFAPVKKIQTALIVQKATELGVREIMPVQTVRTNADKIRPDKMMAQAIEAAEQSERLTVPVIQKIRKLGTALDALEADRSLIFCQERYDGRDAISTLQDIRGTGKWAVLIGPEGGFTQAEIELAKGKGFLSHSLGPRILRAETASISSCTLIQYLYGDI